MSIAIELFISESIVKSHITSIFNRLNLKNRASCCYLREFDFAVIVMKVVYLELFWFGARLYEAL